MANPATTGNLVSIITGAQIGDFIPCRYTAASNTAGIFSELGTCVSSEIPVTGTATPDGLFNFIKVDKGLWIADRVVQAGISWDTLNAAKLIEGKHVATTNVAYNGTAVASSFFSSSATYAPDKAFDNNKSTFWNSEVGSPQWLSYQWVTPRIIIGYGITAYNNASRIYDPKNWTFEGSNDGITWIVLDKKTTQTLIQNTNKPYFFANTTAYTRYRINITGDNGGGQAVISELELYDTEMLYRSLSGGNSYLDANGNSSMVSANLGAWPSINEWDTYLVNSNLDGKITADDNNVWHWSGIYNWVIDTPILNLWGVTTSGFRVNRGNQSVSYFNASISSTVWSSMGFRPVLECKE